jgi:hypothetical protein
MRASDQDNDATKIALIYDGNTPSGVYFDATTGAFEWTPDFNTVDNLSVDSRAFVFNFTASDGSATTSKSVQVRVFDVNREPLVSTSNRALLVGQAFSLPVLRGASSPMGAINVSDPDGQAQTQRLSVSFANLPEGASYDSASDRLNWTPGPGQVGDFIVLAQVSDGRNTQTQSYTLRVVADATANAPKILVNTTPSTPVLPGQDVLATVRVTSFGPVVDIAVRVRGLALGLTDWATMPLDGLGRLRLSPSAPGLVEIEVRAIDADGFANTQTQTVAVRDPRDSAKPLIAWSGAIDSAGLAPSQISQATALEARISDLQLMGWQLEIAPENGGVIDERAWGILASHVDAGLPADSVLTLTTIDPATLSNGVYQLRLSAWDLSGRTTEISSRLLIDSSTKTFTQASKTDANFMLGGHAFTLTRRLDTQFSTATQAFDNWILPVLDVHLTTDQNRSTALGGVSPWSQGARLWLQVPTSLTLFDAPTQFLSFTLATRTDSLSSQPGSPTTLRPIFDSSNGWHLEANDGDESRLPALQSEYWPALGAAGFRADRTRRHAVGPRPTRPSAVDRVCGWDAVASKRGEYRRSWNKRYGAARRVRSRRTRPNHPGQRSFGERRSTLRRLSVRHPGPTYFGAQIIR